MGKLTHQGTRAPSINGSILPATAPAPAENENISSKIKIVDIENSRNHVPVMRDQQREIWAGQGRANYNSISVAGGEPGKKGHTGAVKLRSMFSN